MKVTKVRARLGVAAVVLCAGAAVSGVAAIGADAGADGRGGPPPPGSATPVRSCASLAELQLPDTTITPTAAAGDGSTPASCRVHLTVTHPPAGDVVNIWVYLPDTGWNGRFQGVGGGGYSGGSERSLLEPLQQGFAAGATDAGSPGTGAQFFLNPDHSLNWQRARNWGYLGIHDMTVRAKALVAAYYGGGPRYSYWNGCSTGGRQGLTEAQRYPADYDGILAGAPVINLIEINASQMWPQLLMLVNDNAIAPCKFEAAVKAVVEACDTVGDGVQDGVIGDPRACDWDPSALVGEQTPCGTITKADADIMRATWTGPRRADGSFIWYGIQRGARFSGIATTEVVDGKLVGKPRNTQVMGSWVLQDPDWDWTTLTQPAFEQIFDWAAEIWDPTQSSNDPDLRAFQQRGGKILMWHGLSDFGVPPEGSMDYVEQVRDVVGPGRTDGFLRLFLAPGVDHCGGGPGAQPTGQFEDLIAWVEHGKAPSTLDAVKSDDAGSVVARRPVCAYPQVARYTGHGDAADAASYRCVKTARLVPSRP
jgi:feruloyl esterase